MTAEIIRDRLGHNDREPGVDLLGTYLDEIAQHPLLDAVQEVELAKAIEAGLYAQVLIAANDTRHTETGMPPTAEETQKQQELVGVARLGAEAKGTFICSNLRLVVGLARRYGYLTGDNGQKLTTIQNGNLGLIRAVEKFDYTKGCKFSTYAANWIRQAIERNGRNDGRVIHLPQEKIVLIKKLDKVESALTLELGRTPGVSELAEALGATEAEVENLQDIRRHPISIDAPLDGGQAGPGMKVTTIGDLIEDQDAADPAAAVLATERKRDLYDLLAQLPELERQVVTLHHGIQDGQEWPLGKIAAYLGVDRNRASKINSNAIELLRQSAVRASGE
jgi:RNA polymerase sigma factor (sigma-70 family)